MVSVVEFQTGHYERTTIPVKCFSCSEQARSFINDANKFLKEIHYHYQSEFGLQELEEVAVNKALLERFEIETDIYECGSFLITKVPFVE